MMNGVGSGTMPAYGGKRETYSATNLLRGIFSSRRLRNLAAGGTPPPTITGVQDAGSYTANVAQGSIFVVKGTGPSNAGFFQAGFFPEGYPLPTTSAASNAGGVSITFTALAGGNGTKAYLIYEYNRVACTSTPQCFRRRLPPVPIT